jgi:hypothetical protein
MGKCNGAAQPAHPAAAASLRYAAAAVVALFGVLRAPEHADGADAHSVKQAGTPSKKLPSVIC